MHDIREAAQAFGDMYETLFQYFFGRNSAEANKSYRIPKYFNSHPNKCPAQALVINVLAEVLSEHPEQLPENKKTVRSYLSRSRLIDFDKLDDIYAAVNDQQLDLQRIEQYKADILDIINPQYLVALHLYMKYHKIFDRELFDAFCRMVVTGDRCTSQNISSFCFATLSTGEELVAALKECIYGTNGKVSSSSPMLYISVYADFLKVRRDYPSFDSQRPSLQRFKAILNEVLQEVNWDSRKPNKTKQGELYKFTIQHYLNILTEIIKKKVIVNLDTKSGQGKGNQPNLRTIRSRSKAFTYCFRLAVPFGNKKQNVNELQSCPVFLLRELWVCLEQHPVW